MSYIYNVEVHVYNGGEKNKHPYTLIKYFHYFTLHVQLLPVHEERPVFPCGPSPSALFLPVQKTHSFLCYIQ